MQHDWPANRMGEIAIRDNLFHANGSLFSTATLEEGEFAAGIVASVQYGRANCRAVDAAGQAQAASLHGSRGAEQCIDR